MSDRNAIALDAYEALCHSETSIDVALGATARFLAGLTDYRVAAGLSATAGQKVFAATARANALLAEARGEIVASHNALEALRRAMKLDPVRSDMSPPMEKPPTGEASEFERPRLVA